MAPAREEAKDSFDGVLSTSDAEQLVKVLSRQGDGEAHDLGLIVERLAWTPEERLDANTAFLRLYSELRPDGPLIRE